MKTYARAVPPDLDVLFYRAMALIHHAKCARFVLADDPKHDSIRRVFVEDYLDNPPVKIDITPIEKRILESIQYQPRQPGTVCLILNAAGRKYWWQ